MESSRGKFEGIGVRVLKSLRVLKVLGKFEGVGVERNRKVRGGGHRKFEVMGLECACVRGFEKFEGTVMALNVLGKFLESSSVWVESSWNVQGCGVVWAFNVRGYGLGGARVWARKLRGYGRGRCACARIRARSCARSCCRDATQSTTQSALVGSVAVPDIRT